MMSPKENGSRVEGMSNGDKKPEASSLSVASDLIRMMDSAFYEMSSAAASAAKEAEDARRNAHAVSELARRFSSPSRENRNGGNGEELPSSSVSTSLNEKTTTEAHPENTRTTNSQEIDVSGEDLAHAVKESTAMLLPDVDETSTESSPQSVEADEGVATGGKRLEPQLQPEVTSERVAQSHADDVLALTLELDRTKEALEEEQSSRHQMKAALQEMKSKNVQLEAQVQKLKNEMETQREDDRRKTDSLQYQLEQAQIRVEAAEEDAQLALDLAKGNAEDREMVETWLQRSLQEVQVLRDQLQHAGVSPKEIFSSPSQPPFDEPEPDTKKRVVRFADAPTQPSPQSPKVAPKSLVVAGKSVLLHSGGKPSSPSDAGQHALHSIVFTPEKSAERRRKLRERIEDINQTGTPSSSSTAIVPSPGRAIYDGADMGYAFKAMEHCQNIVSLLRESGKRLRLGGHWWTRDAPDETDPNNVEAMARQYCHSVEMKLDRQKGEMSELHALCDYLEQNLKSSTTPTSASK